MDTQNRPLSGIRVLSVETQVAGPTCTMMLADAGAEVIKIETPGRGDVAREPGPILSNEEGGNTSGYFMRFNRNKKSLTLNLKTPKGKSILEELVKESDVILENLKPGTLEGLGLGYAKLSKINPKIVHVSISGFGISESLKGPYSDWPAYDIVTQAMGGFMHMVGNADGPPLHPMIALGDVVPGMVTAYAITLALYKRAFTGQGDFIDMAMYDVMLALAERPLHNYSMTGQVMMRGKETLIHPWGAFQTKDGYVAMIVLENKMWKRLCDIIERPELVEDERFKNAMLRAKNRNELDPILNEWLINFTSDDVVKIFLEHGLPVGKVQNAEDIYNCPQASARKMWVKTNDPIAGEIKLIGNLIKSQNYMPAVERVDPVPSLGEHTESILGGLLNYSDVQIAELKSDGII